MNRRSFVAGVPVLLPAAAFAQEATPEAVPWPEAVMVDLIQTLFVDRSLTAAANLLSPNANQDAMLLNFANVIEWLENRYGDDPIPLSTVMIASEDNKAMALLDIGDPREVYAFLYITTDGGGIIGIRSEWGEF